ncbi:nucleotidyltransferase [Bacillus sp. 1P06AnD]|uniref:nucleotidyltransferase n=1 Tax=Bacillus sp. 1P06AnD TaxID=3132208 RepID=UPI0039A1E13C
MKAVGLVVEYNPFHNGHRYHVEESKKQNDADVAIAVMSGSFLQRGEPALINKWDRAKMALLGGVDLVIELPYIFSTQHAVHFAEGSIGLLEALRCDTFCFGSENGTIEDFIQAYHVEKDNRATLDAYIKQFSKEGFNYPTSVSMAWKKVNRDTDIGIDLSQPNNILGYQYVSAVLKNGYSIHPSLISRIGSNYHDEFLPKGQIASATSIRKAIMSQGGEATQAAEFMPNGTYTLLFQYQEDNHLLHHWELYWPLLQYTLLSTPVDQLRTFYEVEEGIEFRLKEAAMSARSFNEFIHQVKTKRYTLTRLQRICVHLLTKAEKEKMKKMVKEPSYLRILGFNEKGRAYLHERKKHFGLPVVTKAGSFRHPALSYDIQAATIHSLPLPPAAKQTMIIREFKQPVIL